MPIFKGDNWQHLYKGDGHPAALYKGSKKLAGWTEESQAGVSHAYFDDTYNDKADVTIHGKSTQVETTGAQLIDFSKSSFNYCSLENANTGTLKSNFTDFYYGGIGITYLNEYLLSKRGETITFSAIDGIPEKNMSIVIFGTRADGSINQEKSSNPGENLVSLTVAQDFETITGAELRFNRSSSAFTDTNTLVTGVMLNTGNTAIPFEPYTGGAPSPSPDYPQEITSVGDSGSVEVVSTGAQLIDFEKDTMVYCTLQDSDTGTVKSNISNSYFCYINITRLNEYIMKNKGKTLIFSIESGIPDRSVSICIFGSLKTGGYVQEQTSQKGSRSVAIKISQDFLEVTSIQLRFNRNPNESYTDTSTIISGLIFSEGSTVQDFQPYRSSTATFSTPNGLPGIPVDSGGNYTDEDGQQWICDEIDTKAGVYRQRVGKITFDGGESEGWSSYDNANFKGFMILEPNMKSGTRLNGMCDRFTIDKNYSSETYGIWLGSNNQYIYFHNCNPSIASSLEEWRTWLSTNPVTLIYPLATPVETPLSDAVDTFLGGTNLFISEHEMDVTVKTEDQANPTGA